MATKACVACSKQITAAFQKCNFCGAEQPVMTVPPAAKEARCATCKRPYSAKLTECPFCVRDRAAGVQPAAFGATRPRSVRPPASSFGDEPDENRTLKTGLLLGLPLLLGGLWGIAEVVYATSLGGDESSTMTSASIVAGLFVAPLLALLFLRRSYGTMGDAVDTLGMSKTIVFGFVATAIAIVPVVLFVTGFSQWFNAMGAEAQAQVVECKVGSVWHRVRKTSDMGWYVSYTCDLEGDHLVGSVGGLAARPDFVEGGPVHFRAARGRLGRWVRFGDPLPPNATFPPSTTTSLP